MVQKYVENDFNPHLPPQKKVKNNKTYLQKVFVFDFCCFFHLWMMFFFGGGVGRQLQASVECSMDVKLLEISHKTSCRFWLSLDEPRGVSLKPHRSFLMSRDCDKWPLKNGDLLWITVGNLMQLPFVCHILFNHVQSLLNSQCEPQQQKYQWLHGRWSFVKCHGSDKWESLRKEWRLYPILEQTWNSSYKALRIECINDDKCQGINGPNRISFVTIHTSKIALATPACPPKPLVFLLQALHRNGTLKLWCNLVLSLLLYLIHLWNFWSFYSVGQSLHLWWSRRWGR